MLANRWVVLTGILAAFSPVFAGAGHSDFEVGQLAGRLVLLGDTGATIHLEPGDGVFTGLFIASLPGWESLEADEPPDAFMLAPGHQVALQRLAFDPGFEMYESFGATQILATDGATYLFSADAGGAFHEDLVYAGQGPQGATYSAQFRLVDGSNAYAPSEPFKLSFEVVPEPATGLAMVACWIVVRRIRRFRSGGIG